MKVLPCCSRAAKLTGLIALTILAVAALYLFIWGPFNQGEKKDKIFALVYVAPKQPRILFEEKANGEEQEFSQYLQTQIRILKSRFVLNAALNNPEVRQLKLVKQPVDPVAWLEGLVEVQVDKQQTGILRVTVAVDNPNDQMVLTNAVVVAYVDAAVTKEHATRLTRLEMLKKLHADYDKQLREKRLQLQLLSGGLGSRNAKHLAMKEEFALKQLSSAQGELLQVESQIRKAKGELESAQTMEKVPDAPVGPKELELALDKHQAVAPLLTEMDKLETTLTTLKRLLANPEKEPGYLNTLERLEGARKDLTAIREKMRPVVALQLRDQHQIDQEAQRQATKQRLSQMVALQKILSNEVKDRTEIVLSFNKKQEDLQWLKDDITHQDETASKIGQLIQVLQVELQAPSRITLLEEAVASGR